METKLGTPSKDISIGGSGASVDESAEESKKKALFGGPQLE